MPSAAPTPQCELVPCQVESEHLGVPVGSPAMLIERVTNDADGRPFEYVKSVYRGDRYRDTTRLSL